MPIYEYQCAKCGHQLEVLQKFSDEPLRRCTACGEDSLTKLISATNFQLKGGGWYKASPSSEGSANKTTTPNSDVGTEVKKESTESVSGASENKPVSDSVSKSKKDE